MELLFKEWRRPYEVDYFDLEEYINKIVISDFNQSHLLQVNKKYEEYLKKLRSISHFDETKDGYALIYKWLDDGRKELVESAQIEGHKISFSNDELISGELFFESVKINNERIKKIHKFVCERSDTTTKRFGEYRKDSACVSKPLPDGTEDIYWYGVKANDIPAFIKSFINYCKDRKLDPKYYNPFIKSALVHMLFVRIHPFEDGNGRTARILHNITFTSEINKFYNTNLKLCPLNISTNIKLYQPSYIRRINMVKFNLDEPTNEEINLWLDFILRMYEEQIEFQSKKLEDLEQAFQTISLLKEDDDEIVKLAKISKVDKML